jgi:hypothetical protein
MLRNSEKPYGDGEGYKHFRGPHQHTDGPEHHPTVSAVALAYVNLLEERIYVLDLELGAMRDRFGHQLDFRGVPDPAENLPDMQAEPKAMAAEPAFYKVAEARDQMADVRAKNTELEKINQSLRHRLNKLEDNLFERGFQPEPTQPAQHPWDVELAEPGNPLGVSARQRILGMAQQIADLQTEHDNVQSAYNRLLTQPQFLAAYQEHVHAEVARLWGEGAYANSRERILRFAEEAVELMQAGHLTASDIGAVVNHVMSRPVGDMQKEAGGVMVTLAALAGSHGFWLQNSARDELKRLKSKKSDEMQARHNAKPASIKAAP